MDPPGATARPAESRSRLRSIWRATRPLRWAIGLGAFSGLVAAGIGSRIVMRLIALADPSSDGTFTDAEAIVGEITVDGTLNLLVAGTIAGILGGLLYLALRRWPVPPAWNGVAFGVLALVTVATCCSTPATPTSRYSSRCCW